jgi:hypothetical protein
MSERLTKKEAKELSLEVWRYLREHPEISSKFKLPRAILDKVVGFPFLCPLCALFSEFFSEFCPGCPLDIKNCHIDDSPYDRWSLTTKRGPRREAAAEIVSVIEAWEPEEE